MSEKYGMLQLRYIFDGIEQTVCPVLLFGADDIVLVDCGYPGSLELIEQQLRYRRIEPAAVTKLILTHQDDDHMGAAAEWREKYPKVRILASSLEAPYISGKRKNLRLQQAEKLQSELPEDQREWGERFCGRYRRLRPVSVDVPLHSGDVFDWGGGCEIIGTPGHTPGHISIRSLNNDFLITGDAAALEGGRLVVANPDYCMDIERAERSLEAISSCRCGEYICYHGGLLK